MRTTFVALALLALTPTLAPGQSLMEASAAALKAKADSPLVWIAPRTTVATVTEPVPGTPATPAAPAAASVSGVASNTQTANALIGARLVALAQVVVSGRAASAKYSDACAGKESSAGWLLRGELVTTQNADTPACLTIAAELSRLSGRLRSERSAITETARVGGIFPGVLRDLFARHGIPD